jgi:hypothetical protein
MAGGRDCAPDGSAVEGVLVAGLAAVGGTTGVAAAVVVVRLGPVAGAAIGDALVAVPDRVVLAGAAFVACVARGLDGAFAAVRVRAGDAFRADAAFAGAAERFVDVVEALRRVVEVDAPEGAAGRFRAPVARSAAFLVPAAFVVSAAFFVPAARFALAAFFVAAAFFALAARFVLAAFLSAAFLSAAASRAVAASLAAAASARAVSSAARRAARASRAAWAAAAFSSRSRRVAASRRSRALRDAARSASAARLAAALRSATVAFSRSFAGRDTGLPTRSGRNPVLTTARFATGRGSGAGFAGRGRSTLVTVGVVRGAT